MKPVVWRRFQVLNCTLPEFHEIVQIVMGWENKHPYCFEIAGTRYCDPSLCEDLDCADGRRVKLGHLVKDWEQHIEYLYDFGDNWRHTVEIESGFEPEEAAGFLACLEGSGNCPPEDVGGPSGCAELLKERSRPRPTLGIAGLARRLV